MKHVERAVRPVVAPLARKMKMRTELLAHLTELYEQELLRADDARDAVAAATRRLGDPQDIARELRSTVSRVERVIGRIDLFDARPGESPVRHATRYATTTTPIVALLVGLLALRIAFIAPGDRPPLAFAAIAWMSIFGNAVAGFLFVFLGRQMERLIRNSTDCRRAWASAAGLAILMGVTAFLLFLGFFAAILDGMGLASSTLSFFPQLWGILVLGPIIFLGLTIIGDRQKRLSAPWAELTI